MAGLKKDTLICAHCNEWIKDKNEAVKCEKQT